MHTYLCMPIYLCIPTCMHIYLCMLPPSSLALSTFYLLSTPPHFPLRARARVSPGQFVTHTFTGVGKTKDAIEALHSGECLRTCTLYANYYVGGLLYAHYM